MQQEDSRLLDEFSTKLREKFKEELVFNVIDNAEALKLIDEAAQTQYLHRCNGCELTLVNKIGAEYVIVPWVFRMSKLVQAFFIEIRDVKTGKPLMWKGLSFRGNTDDAWEHVIVRQIQVVEVYLKQKN